MSVTELAPSEHRRARTTADLDIVIPVHNEVEQLAPSITRLRSYTRRIVPIHLDHHDCRQRQHRRHPVHRHPQRPSLLRTGTGKTYVYLRTLVELNMNA